MEAERNTQNVEEVMATPIKRGVFAWDDHAKFGALVDDLERLGAYLVVWSPKKQAILAWFRGRDFTDELNDTILGWGHDMTVKPGKNNNFVVVELHW